MKLDAALLKRLADAVNGLDTLLQNEGVIIEGNFVIKLTDIDDSEHRVVVRLHDSQEYYEVHEGAS